MCCWKTDGKAATRVTCGRDGGWLVLGMWDRPLSVPGTVNASIPAKFSPFYLELTKILLIFAPSIHRIGYAAECGE